MESLRVITETILQEARKSAKNIIQEAQESAEAMLEEQRKQGIQKANTLTPSILKKAEREAEIDRLSLIANAKMKANWAVLSKKESLIAKVLKEVKSNLSIQTRLKIYIPILEKLIAEAGIILGGKELEVLLNEQDSTLNLRLDKLAKEIGEKTGFKTKLRLSEEKIKVIGGAMLRSMNGKVVMDNTFEDIFKRREKDLRFKIAQILFE
jgi:V/A-type H+-transporting ATPase subunit E